MSYVKKFESLDCWKATRKLTHHIYKASCNEMLAKDFGMQNQLRRAALSTMNNIAGGFGRYHKKEFV